MKKQSLTCIQCPLGCRINVVQKDKQNNFSGYECKKGIEYAKNEITDPRRIVTTTVFIKNGTVRLLPVRSEKEIPKYLVRKCINELSNLKVKAPIKCGDTIYKNILKTGINIIATRDIDNINKK
jgi:CxxC motif-containing protein